jgi:signal peptidase
MDQNPVKFSDLIGKTITLIPYLGYLVLMGRQLMVYLVFIPSAIVILSEVRAMMTNPVLLLKRERQQRKLERLPVSVNYRRLLTIFILTSLPFWILGLPSLALTNIGGEGAKYGQGNTITIQGAGLMDQIYVIRDNDKPILPGYGVISPEKSVEVQVQDPGAVTVSMTPAVIPIFWAVNLASVHPAFPALVTSLIPGLLILLVLYPLWIGRRRSRSKRRMRRLPFGSSIV